MADPVSLKNMYDIIEPSAAGFWPPADGVWLLGALVLVWGIVAALVLWTRRRKNAYRRAGMQALRNIRLRLDTPDGKNAAVRELAVLLKRVAMTAFGRETVATLNGERWLAFLDDTLVGGTFSSPAGNLLTHMIYGPSHQLLDEAYARQIDELFHLAGRWIEKHRSTVPVAYAT
ncbi:MAG: DUF4381 domain-containing protein [Desulfatitalea sp.]|nr:DUF4381 domain-containing protein [Desulfatitalea sp.]NNK02068.1 DUF4381 domain-containing protein [Desulfatitalea sp.]